MRLTKIPFKTSLFALLSVLAISSQSQLCQAGEKLGPMSPGEVQWIFGLNPALNAFSVTPGSHALESTLAAYDNDMKWLSHLEMRPTSKLFRAAFGGDLNQNTFETWIRKFIRKIVITDEPNDRFKHFIALNLSIFDAPGSVVVFPAFGNGQNAQASASRLSHLIHEAIHSDPRADFHAHAPCPANYPRGLAGIAQCDDHFGGPSTFAAIFLREVAFQCKNCSDELKKSAWNQFRETVMRIIHTEDRAALFSGIGISRSPITKKIDWSASMLYEAD